MPDAKIPYDPSRPDKRLLRLAFFEKLRKEPRWDFFSYTESDLKNYIDNIPGAGNARDEFLALAGEVFWSLLQEGILAPRFQADRSSLQYFHLTDLGRSIVASTGPNPFDPEGYITFLKQRVPNADSTVIAYLAESLNTQRRGTLVASAVMLGIAAERVFLLLCESLLVALKDAKEKKQFGDILDRFPMKPKLDWVRTKIEALQKQKLAGIPDTAGLMIIAIYDLIRQQRNELGHPREVPPALTRDDVLGGLQVFIRYYETAENLRTFLATTTV